MKFPPVAMLAGVCLTTACAPTLTKPPAASAVMVPEQWRTTLPSQTREDAVWWNGFGDPLLSRLVDAARAHNPNVAIAALRIEEARAQERVSRSALLPNVDLSVSGAESRSVSPFGTAAANFAA